MMAIFIFLVLSQICQVPAVNKTSSINQDTGVIKANVGQNVTLKCISQNDAVTFLSWYQQKIGSKPVLISSWLKKEEVSIFSPFKERFQVSTGGRDGTNHLIIQELDHLDSATYYCGILQFNIIELGEGVFLHVRASPSNIRSVLGQPPLKQLRSGDSVNLSCTVHAGECAGEKTLYWFRHRAPELKIMDKNPVKCGFSPQRPDRECTLNLTLSLSSPHAGMYYCALDSCGEIVFGNGTRVEIEGGSTRVSLLLVCCLGAALAVLIVLLLALAFVLYKLTKNSCSFCKGVLTHPARSAASDIVNQDADVYYAALSLNRKSQRPPEKDNVESTCVYSGVKSRKR
uniref:Ig-like domain-containing protein n=1 Tax=Gasterosteus aculeatus aculeatus TaxID=481459 RepID=A0AAQ4R3R9_GASAC|nr:uncharacterized protein LOC120822221 [Gasterosteus aculeatus aculeatus]